MQIGDNKYKAYINILENEIVPATGCTEPASLALAAAAARDVLGCIPECIIVETNSNIIKNAKSVVVPNTNGMRGIPSAIAAGIIAGKADKGLDVISDITEKEIKEIQSFIESRDIQVIKTDTNLLFDILVTLTAEIHTAQVRITDRHTNISFIKKDEEIILDNAALINNDIVEANSEYELLNIADIVKFADIADINDISTLICGQIEMNTAIADAGISNAFGANIGKVLLSGANDVKTRAKAMSAAASDARMSGCEMPVAIIAGSGNQGITTVIPIVEYAKTLKSDNDRLIRAVILADLVTLHIKRYIGRLSAYCGVVSAGAASGAGIAYLYGGKYDEISHTIVNALAITSGMICDGAKPSCAAKIALAVEAGILGYEMFLQEQQFYRGEGIVKSNVEDTIKGIGVIGREGMLQTDATIIDVMMTD